MNKEQHDKFIAFIDSTKFARGAAISAACFVVSLTYFLHWLVS